MSAGERARNGLTVASLVWLTYCFLELFNPQTVSATAWVALIRGYALYFVDRIFSRDRIFYYKRPETYPIHLVRADVAGHCSKLDPAQLGFDQSPVILAFCRTRTYHASSGRSATSRSSATRRTSARQWASRWSYSASLALYYKKPVDPAPYHCRSRRGLLRHVISGTLALL